MSTVPRTRQPPSPAKMINCRASRAPRNSVHPSCRQRRATRVAAHVFRSARQERKTP